MQDTIFPVTGRLVADRLRRRASAGLRAPLFTSVPDGGNESVTGDVEQVLGRPPHALPDRVREAATTAIREA